MGTSYNHGSANMQGDLLLGVESNLAAEQIALRRQVLDWRDRWSIEAELRLRAVLAARSNQMVVQINCLSHKDLALARIGGAPIPILAEIVDEATRIADRLLIEAGDGLAAIVAHHLDIEARAAVDVPANRLDRGQLIAMGKSAAPILAAAGLSMALPGLATTTSVALFGLVTTTTVSAPILIAGIGSIAALSAIGVLNLSGLRRDQERRLRDAVYVELEARLLVLAGDGREPSLLARLETGFAEAADHLTRKR